MRCEVVMKVEWHDVFPFSHAVESRVIARLPERPGGSGLGCTWRSQLDVEARRRR